MNKNDKEILKMNTSLIETKLEEIEKAIRYIRIILKIENEN